jgi:hypothetical protein
LEEYRVKLQVLNRAIRDYNLSVPDAIHENPVLIDRAVQRLGEEAPEIDLERVDVRPPTSRRRRWLRWRR